MIRILIECILVSELRPSFLSVTEDESFIHVILSHPLFLNISIEDRISKVYALLEKHDVSFDKCLVVECFDSDQINELFESVML